MPDTVRTRTWSALGPGTRGTVNALAMIGADLFAGGDFTTAGGYLSAHIGIYHNSALNQTPVANPDTAGTCQGQPLVIGVAKLLANDTDADGDALTLAGVSATSTQGGIVSLNAGAITYTPAAGFNGSDTFTYTVNDAHGATASSTVTVTVAPSAATALNIVYGPVSDGGNFVVRFAGIPGYTYTIESTDSLSSANWHKRVNATAPMSAGSFGSGVFEFSECTSGAPSCYYRTVWPAY